MQSFFAYGDSIYITVFLNSSFFPLLCVQNPHDGYLYFSNGSKIIWYQWFNLIGFLVAGSITKWAKKTLFCFDIFALPETSTGGTLVNICIRNGWNHTENPGLNYVRVPRADKSCFFKDSPEIYGTNAGRKSVQTRLRTNHAICNGMRIQQILRVI